MTHHRSLHWHSLSQKHIPILRKHYLQFEPYSDFNAVSLWGYMGNKAKWCKTGDTMLYQMIDYVSGERFFSLLGKSDSRRAITELCTSESTSQLTLRLVPEITARALKSWAAVTKISADTASHDYIFRTNDLIELQGHKFKSKRKLLHQFNDRHPYVMMRIVDLRDPNVRRKIYHLFTRWAKDNHKDDYEIEFTALKRAVNLKNDSIICVAATEHGRLIGYTINEIDGKEFYQAHYGKTKHSYKGLSLVMEHETAKIMYEQYGLTYMNLQQDLGIPGLRKYKHSLGPEKRLRKFSVTIDLARVKTVGNQ